MNFTPLTKEDAPALGAVLEAYGALLCDYTFLSLYMWGDVYVTDYARVDDLWILRSTDPEGAFYYYTIPHRGADFVRGLSILREAVPGRLMLWALDEGHAAIVKQLFGDRVTFHTNEAENDYLYEIDDLADMAGRRFSAKRNHIHAFLREHPDYVYTVLTPDLLPAVRDFYRAFQETEEDDSETAREEGRAVWPLLVDFERLPIEGGVLLVDGRIVGFFLGEVVGEVLFLHVEKALREVRGAYPMLVRETARRYRDLVRYENREEDDGDSGLRQSKRSYCPCAWLPKITAAVEAS